MEIKIMATYELDTKVYTDFAAAEADANLDFDVWSAAATAYWAAKAEAEAKWAAIPEGEAKDSAMFNANDMQMDGLFSAANRLAWCKAAVDTYEMNA
jgi:hypothetical protein